MLNLLYELAFWYLIAKFSGIIIQWKNTFKVNTSVLWIQCALQTGLLRNKDSMELETFLGNIFSSYPYSILNHWILLIHSSLFSIGLASFHSHYYHPCLGPMSGWLPWSFLHNDHLWWGSPRPSPGSVIF